jgi:hypothetical protein
VEFVVESTSDDTVFKPSFVTVGSGFQVILRLLPQKFQSLQCR